MNEVDLIDLVYRAVLSDDWQSIAAALSRGTSPISTHMYGHDMEINKVSLEALAGHDPEMLGSCDRSYDVIFAWIPGVTASAAGKATRRSDYCSDEELQGSQFFDDWLRPPQRGARVAVVLFNGRRHVVVFGDNARYLDREAKEQRWLELPQRVRPRLRNGFAFRRRLRSETLVNRGYLDLIDRLPDGIFLIDADGRIQFRNRAATRLSADRALVFIDRAGALRLTDPSADERMQAGLAAIRRRDYHALGTSFPVRRTDCAQLLSATLAPFVADPDATGYLTDFAAARLPVAVMTVHDRLHGQSPQALLSMTYGLTAAETELAMALRGGASLKAHAEQRRVSLHTVRNQLKSVFDKTGVHRQAELVSLLSKTLD